MDPNANLRQQEYIIDVKIDSGLNAGARREARRELAELRDALDVWLRNGGFEPDWTQAPKARKFFRK